MRITPTQNRALHLYFQKMADALNRDGKTVIVTLKKANLDSYWTKTLFKELYWRDLQKKAFGIESTTKLTHQQIDMMLDIISKEMAETHDLYVGFPSIKTLVEDYKGRENKTNI